MLGQCEAPGFMPRLPSATDRGCGDENGGEGAESTLGGLRVGEGGGVNEQNAEESMPCTSPGVETLAKHRNNSRRITPKRFRGV